MEEQLILFETAKLAKEKGFKEECYATYYDYPNMYKREYSSEKLKERNLDKVELRFNISEIWIHPSERRNGYLGCDPPEHYIRYIEYNSHLKNNNIFKKDSARKYWYSAPTQSLLQKWLREVHNIFIAVYCDSNRKFDYHAYDIDRSKSKFKFDGEYNGFEIGAYPYRYDTYEQALEIGLQEALELIIK